MAVTENITWLRKCQVTGVTGASRGMVRSTEIATHRGHLAGDEVAVLRQHVRHHECGQLWVGVRVDEPIVWQRVAEVACGVVLHQVKKRRLGVVGRSDGGDLVVLVPGSVPTARAAAAASSPAAAGLTCVALKGETERWKSEITQV